MEQEQLNKLIKELKISADQILREEAEMIFLRALGDSPLGSKTVFYGGTAMRLAYNSPRFSEDIDLIKIKPLKFTEFKKFIRDTVKQNSNWSVKDIKDKRQTMFALILIKDSKLKHNFSIKVEAHKPAKNPVLDQSLTLIKSPISVLEPLLLVPSLEKLKELKINALHGRKKARDIFDLWYLARLNREIFSLPVKTPKYKKKEFENELKVFLPKNYYPIINELYEQVNKSN
ncbi:MAG: nucleotidyl transferase AbiEii/AbiGii toxin family protein [Candidatus Falkowbacteria bacterium]